MARPSLKAPSSLVPLLALLIVIGTLYFAREVLIPFSLAMLFAFILTPAVRQMEALHLGRGASVLIVTVVLSFASGIGWIGAMQLVDVIDQIPKYKQNIHDKA